MKVINQAGGRVLLQWSSEDVSPRHGLNLSTLFAAIVQRYGFVSAPNPVQAQQALLQANQVGNAGGVPNQPPIGNFFSGHLTKSGNSYAIPQFDYFIGAGMVTVTAQSTDYCDLFLDDLIAFLEAELGFRGITDHSTRRYGSVVTVEFEKGIEAKLGIFAKMAALINAKASEEGAPPFYGFERLAFGRDPSTIATVESASYSGLVIERRGLRPHEKNRFHCYGPLRTNTLVEVLRGIEEIAAATI